MFIIFLTPYFLSLFKYLFAPSPLPLRSWFPFMWKNWENERRENGEGAKRYLKNSLV